MIEFESDAEDWAASGDYLLTHSSTLSSAVRKARWVTIAVVVAMLAIAWVAFHSIAAVVGGSLAGLYMVALVPHQSRERMKRHMKKMWAESQAAGVSNACQLDASELGLTCRSSVSTGTMGWSAVKRLDETTSHVILSLGPTSAIAIPRARVAGDELSRFVDECRRRIGARGA